MRSRLRQVPGPLWALIAMTTVLAVAWAIASPPLVGADESGHFAYVQHVAETGSAPSSTGKRTLSTEQDTFMRVYGLDRTIGALYARPSTSHLDRDAFRTLERGFGHDQRADGDGPNQFAQNGPLYYSVGAVAYRLTPGGRIVDRVFAVRMVGALLYLAIVVMTWFIAAELFRAEWPRTLAASAVALQPKLGNVAGMVSPDIFLAAIWTAFALVALRSVRHGLTVRRGVLLGALTGASVLTHGRGLALVVPLCAVLLLALPRPRVDWRAHRRPLAIALSLAAAAGVAGFLYTRAKTGVAYGGELDQAAGGAGSTGSLHGLVAYLATYYFGAYEAFGPVLAPQYGYRQGYIETFFGSLGSLDVLFKPHVYDWLQFLAAAGLVALWTQVAIFRRALLRRWREVAVLVVLVVSQVALLHVAAYRDIVQTNGVGILWSGRYLLPLIAVFGVTVAYVCSHLPRRAQPVVAGVVLAAGVAFQLSSLAITLDRFYG